MRTTGPATALKLTAEPDAPKPTEKDLVFVTAQFTDQAGLLVPEAKSAVRFSLGEPGEIVAIDNGDAANMESFASPERAAFNGRCLVIIRRTKGHAVLIKLRGQSGGLAGTVLEIGK